MMSRRASVPDEAASTRTRWLTPPQAGRLVPLALAKAGRDVDEVVFTVTTGGLSQRQIEDTPLGGMTVQALISILVVPLRHFFAKVLRRPRTDDPGRPVR